VDWTCSSNSATGNVNRTLVGKPFGMNHTEVCYGDLNWTEVAQDLLLALFLRSRSFWSRRSVCYFTHALTSPHTTQNIYCISVFAAYAKSGKVTLSFVMSARPSVFLPSICLSLWNNSALAGRVFMKFDI
jgi:hypothetical protein